MRPNRSTMRHRALKVAFAVSWASSIQFAGCLNNAMRTDLSADAERAAITAEQSIAERKQQAAAKTLADRPESGRPESGRVDLAGGELPSEKAEKTIVQASGEKPTAKSKQTEESKPETSKPAPWMFWKKQPAEAEAKAETKSQSKTVAKSGKPAESTASKTGKTAAKPASSSVATDKPSKDAKAAAAEKPFTPDNWFEQEFAAAESRIDAGKKTAAKSEPAQTEAAKPEAVAAKPAAAPVSAAKSAPAVAETKPSKSGSSRPFPGLGEAAEVVPSEKPGTATLPSSDPVHARPASSWPERTAAAPARTIAETAPKATSSWSTDSAAQKSAPTLNETLTQRQQRLRINALMSEAHTSVIRGELHAAYRSALLAEKIATEHQVQFENADENPKEFARDIAAKIWRSTKPGDETLLAETQAAPSPVVEAAQPTEPAPTTTGFPGDSFAMWTPLSTDGKPALTSATATPKTSSAAPLAMTGTPKAAPARPDALPEIRSSQSAYGLSRSQSVTTAPNSLQPAPTALKPTSSSPILTLEAPLPEPETKTAGGVQFAIAQSVTNDREPRLIDPFQSAAPAPAQPSAMASAVMEKQRPFLVAPSVPEPPEVKQARPALTWDQVSETAGESFEDGDRPTPGASKPPVSWRMLWVVSGLLAAGAATVVGLKIARRDPDEYLDFAMLPPKQPEVEQAAENQPLKIKRAA
ncbi:hypothetical protein [Planctomicrobium piriforme]|uniref:Meckel syndrome type 1 protein n=1 Tax=Planctomicrobium piriforme TaxID=1576369 RepID=A0A1I3SQE4_9PLAN|nr:hypothetical protein [Planctomicrobium piriforme]SFJ60935.1 hypothetical protein SAMN05421753_12540 [Planctomicrobium piriforme]